MNRNKLIWILTAADPLAANLEELLQMDGYSCTIYKDIREIKAALPQQFPRAFVLDELNNRGCYAELLPILTGEKNPKLIVLHSDSDKAAFPMADSCLGLPGSINIIADVL
ncbi:MAG TPA: hypothetical protein VHD83_26535 [Puia sp.]|nr:hypothetical protein [Puia sp.]